MSIEHAICRALIDFDIAGYRAAQKAALPYLPPVSDAATIVEMHMARTAKQTVPERHRLYSHAWLRERGMHSDLPHRLKPKADRLYPTVKTGVMIITGSREHGRAVSDPIREAMARKVEEMFADGDTDPEVTKPEMMRAREIERKGLGLGVHDDIPLAWRP